jgi:hypothetical protein
MPLGSQPSRNHLGQAEVPAAGTSVDLASTDHPSQALGND